MEALDLLWIPVQSRIEESEMVRQHKVGWLAWATLIASAFIFFGSQVHAQNVESSWHCIGQDLMEEQEVTFSLKYSDYDGVGYRRVDISKLGPRQPGFWTSRSVSIIDGKMTCGDTTAQAYISLVGSSLKVYAECEAGSLVLEARCVLN